MIPMVHLYLDYTTRGAFSNASHRQKRASGAQRVVQDWSTYYFIDSGEFHVFVVYLLLYASVLFVSKTVVNKRHLARCSDVNDKDYLVLNETIF